MPLLFVPLLARVLLRADVPLDQDALIAAVTQAAQDAETLPPLVAKAALPGVVAGACARLQARGLIAGDATQGWQANADESALLAYYANSIAHFYPEDAAPAP
jgi:glycerol-3-phosphate O-acyltransferase